MGEREVTALLALLGLLAAADGNEDQGFVSRLATRATGAVVDVVDPEMIVERIDVNGLMERVDMDALLARVDINALMARVDMNALIERVDVNALIERVDVNALMARIDVEAIVDRVDVKDVMDRAGIPDVVRESTGALAGSALDVARRTIVALDQISGQVTYRLTGRDPGERPQAPPALEKGVGVDEKGRGQVTGHYAGAVSRLAAFAVDLAVIWGAFVLIGASLRLVADLFLGSDFRFTEEWQWIGGGVLLVWGFLYLWLTVALAGRTWGMTLLGLRVVNREGSPLSGKNALVRTLVFPFSFLFFGLGFLGIFISPERRALHDAAASSAVVYDWGDRPADMPAPLTKWVDTHSEPDQAVAPASPGD
jgi:uncharacterized RDD family membrane protein YckC